MSRIAKRYAKALFKVSEGDLGKAKRDLDSLETLRTLFEDKDAGKILRSPVMPPDLKKTLLYYGLEKAVADSSLKSLIDTLVSSGRVSVIPDLTSAFRDLLNEVEGIAYAEVESAADFSEEEKSAVSAQLSRILEKKVLVDTRVDPTLLGGFVARVGNYRIDMSLKAKLDGLAHSAVQDTLR
jgi:F-type H+-transporting ATPase subunit delta